MNPKDEYYVPNLNVVTSTMLDKNPSTPDNHSTAHREKPPVHTSTSSSVARSCTRLAMLAALTTFSIATAGLAIHQEPFYTWYYSFAWWSYILLVQAWLYSHGGPSLLFRAPARFFLLLPLSVQIWLVFEAYNLRLANWYYVEVPISLWVRWMGYLISFATVLPGIFTTASLIEHFAVIPRLGCASLPRPQRWYSVMILLALAFLFLPLIWPRYFFPMIWGGFILLLEPVNHHLGTDSLLRDWELGSWHRLAVLLLAGGWCGLLWEFWNFWAGTKWVYNIPYVHFFQVFEMPILGFLGFPPFALECYVMVASVHVAVSRVKERLSFRWYVLFWIAVAVMLGILDYWILSAMDRHTVVSYRA